MEMLRGWVMEVGSLWPRRDRFALRSCIHSRRCLLSARGERYSNGTHRKADRTLPGGCCCAHSDTSNEAVSPRWCSSTCPMGNGICLRYWLDIRRLELVTYLWEEGGYSSHRRLYTYRPDDSSVDCPHRYYGSSPRNTDTLPEGKRGDLSGSGNRRV